jgi:tetratricopeptide (TPR) repeat protein
MKRRSISLSIILPLLFCANAASAQTLSEAQTLYNNGNYAKAMPTFRKYVKSQPDNGNYNLWYGVCCLKTNKPDEGLKYLQTAVKKRVTSGQLYLAQAYNNLYRFDDAIKNYEEYIADLTKKKRPTEEAEKLLEQCKSNLRMLKNVEKVCVIDSFVVKKSDFLQAYKISEETGKLSAFNDYFGKEGKHNGTVYMTELGDKIFYGDKDSKGGMCIYTSSKLQNEWSSPTKLPNRINADGDTNYPFVQTDGVTIYYASNGSNSIGGYDIFVSRFNSETNDYFTPENIGMPFNSPYNDYMYVEDEYNDLGWFASDRFQPEGKVCIYVFTLNPSRSSYDYESMDEKKIVSLAKIGAIRDTWKGNEKMMKEGKERLKEAMQDKTVEQSNSDFVFIIDDDTDYHHISDFKSERAKEMFKQLQNKEEEVKHISQKLENHRNRYANAGATEKKSLTNVIIGLESDLDKLQGEIDTLNINIREAEKTVNYVRSK